MDSGWNHSESPFHAGEQQVQDRLGVRNRIENFARRVVRDHMPDQHREFFARLPFVLLGTVDKQGRPWASLMAGRPGFMASPDSRRLEISGQPLPGDPLATTLKPGADVGILGIEPASRRRNRLTGKIACTGADGFAVSIDQTFGNCPQYIQTRNVEVVPGSEPTEHKVIRGKRFDTAIRALIESADTLFIATAYSQEKSAPSRGAPSQGADVSHRGGKPGFVRVENDRTFIFPDFSGNNHFNTLGNIELNPKAGFLFVDFEAGDLIYLTGSAEIVWDGPEVQAFVGAERLIRFRAEEVIRVEGSLPLRFGFGEYSPMLARTGSWVQAAERIAGEAERNTYVSYEIVDIQRESEAISSFHLRRADGKAPASYQPGQFLPIRLTIPGQEAPVSRTYTLSDAPSLGSDAPGAGHYRLSIRRQGGPALVSNFLHDAARRGFVVEAMAPRGKFVLDQASERAVVLISGGVGVTPMIAMTNHIINEGLRTRNFRRTYFIHGARNGRVHAFGRDIRRLAGEHDALTAHIRYSRPGDDDRLGETHDSEGHVDIALLKSILPFDDYDFYLCGPPPFMRSLHDGLIGLGVREERIHYESFGPATVLKHDAGAGKAPAKDAPADGPVAVRFADSDLEVAWSPDRGTLLELAESAGLAPQFACRSGICGTCATRLSCGAVDYLEEPSAPHADGEVLICCATPRPAAGAASCGEDASVVLAL